MGPLLSRDEALALVRQYVKKENYVKHMIAVEAVMRELARRLGEDEAKWGILGLVHDIDFELTRESPEKHGLLAEEILKGKVPEDVIRAIKAHNFERTGVLPESTMEKALVAADAVSGLVVACALVMPNKKLEEVKLKTLKKKFKSKDFARGASREKMKFCEQIGLSLDEFLEIALEGMKKASDQLGL